VDVGAALVADLKASELHEPRQGAFNGLITNDKFCLTRSLRLRLSWPRARGPLRPSAPAQLSSGVPHRGEEHAASAAYLARPARGRADGRGAGPVPGPPHRSRRSSLSRHTASTACAGLDEAHVACLLRACARPARCWSPREQSSLRARRCGRRRMGSVQDDGPGSSCWRRAGPRGGRARQKDARPRPAPVPRGTRVRPRRADPGRPPRRGQAAAAAGFFQRNASPERHMLWSTTASWTMRQTGVRHGSMRQPAAVDATATGGQILGQDARRRARGGGRC
jgi:hypothetical protein